MRQTIGIVVLAALAGSAAAADTVYFTDGPGGSVNAGYGTGGAWNAFTTGHGNFQTFCVELDEHIQIGPAYVYNYVVNPYAEQGGILETDGFNDNKDYLKSTTQNIYYAFRKGINLSQYGDDQAEINDVIQLAIWHVEEGVAVANYGLGGGYGIYASFAASVNAILSNFGGSLMPGAGNVQVMNLSQGGGYNQDVLVVIPLPSAAGLACVGVLGLAAVRRRGA